MAAFDGLTSIIFPQVYHSPSCPIIMGPLRHYVLNVLWIITNLLVVMLTVFHLCKLYKDLSTSSLEAVRIASLVTTMISVTQPATQGEISLCNYIGFSNLTELL